jgi:siroheme synthase (precorrin-2 oxidase/ferrochelatase)/uncharacterized membrane protein
MTSPVNAIVLQHTAPVWAAVISAALPGERLRLRQWLAAAMACCGTGAFFLDGLESGAPAGNAVALAGGASFAFSMIALGFLKDASPALALFYSQLITAALGLPFLLIAPPLVTAANTAGILFLGLAQAGAASLLYAYAIKRLSALNAVLFAQLEPVFNPLWLFLFTGMVPSRYAICGGVIIIAAVLAATRRKLPASAPGDSAAHKLQALNSLRSPCFFPVFVPLAGKRALFIGGGNVALRRVRTLLQFGCHIHIIAEKPHEELEAAAREHSALISIERRPFCRGDCSPGGGASDGRGEKDGRPCFVIAATDNRAVNRAVAEECAARSIPVSVADCKEESTFYFPAIAVHGTIVAGVSSGGNDHGAARDAAAKIREVLQINDHTNRQP